MRIIELTSVKYGIASMVLPELCLNPQLEVVKVVFARKNSSNQIKKLKRKVLKISRIGLLGALNGIRLRKWYSYGSVKDIYSVCKTNNVQFSETGYLNHSKTINIFKEAKADIGVSLGNGYIGKNLFSIPKFNKLVVALACGSKSTNKVFFAKIAKLAARLIAVVVLPTPPFWLMIEIILVIRIKNF